MLFLGFKKTLYWYEYVFWWFTKVCLWWSHINFALDMFLEKTYQTKLVYPALSSNDIEIRKGRRGMTGRRRILTVDCSTMFDQYKNNLSLIRMQIFKVSDSYYYELSECKELCLGPIQYGVCLYISFLNYKLVCINYYCNYIVYW